MEILASLGSAANSCQADQNTAQGHKAAAEAVLPCAQPTQARGVLTPEEFTESFDRKQKTPPT